MNEGQGLKATGVAGGLSIRVEVGSIPISPAAALRSGTSLGS
jgi:hypothetical protein